MIYKMAGRHDPFARVPNTLLADSRLSWKAKGIAAYLCGKPAGWKMRVADLVKQGPDGRSSIRAALDELRAAGYAEYAQSRENGAFSEGEWKISDSPIYSTAASPPRSGNPHPVNPHADNRYHSKKDQKKERKVERKKVKGAFGKAPKSFCPRFDYPLDEEEMIETLEKHGIEHNPDYDGSFFVKMDEAGWLIRGEPVYNWIATYQARLEVTSPAGF